MRLTDRCILKRSGTPWGSPRPCEFGHTGGSRDYDGSGRVKYDETARVIVGPDAALAALATPSGLTVEHKGKTYNVGAILPRNPIFIPFALRLGTCRLFALRL